MKKANKKKLTGIGGLPLAKFTEADERFIAEFINEPKPWEGKIGGGGAWDFKSIKFNPTSILNLPASTTASCGCEDNVCQKCTTSTECKLCHVLSCYHHDQPKPERKHCDKPLTDKEKCKECGQLTTIKEAGLKHKKCPKNMPVDSGMCWNCDEPSEGGYHKAWCIE